MRIFFVHALHEPQSYFKQQAEEAYAAQHDGLVTDLQQESASTRLGPGLAMTGTPRQPLENADPTGPFVLLGGSDAAECGGFRPLHPAADRHP
jgi:hypothetical protein